jgi:nitrogen fixation NifU-like protein
MVKSRSREEAQALMDGFLHLVKGEDAGALSAEDRETLDVMAGLSEFPMRVKCATLAWHTFKSAVEDGATVKSE